MFRGSSIEAGRVLFYLEEIGIKSILLVQQTSVALSCFAIPESADEVQVLVHREEHDKAKTII